MVAFPPCKINLGLHVLRRRSDGYHDIETCFYPVPRTDVLEIVRGSQFRFESSGINIPGPIGDNLCVKAYNLLARDYSLPQVQIFLHKLIPPGSGLGGGSSDATWTLRVLNKEFNLGISDSRLSEYAVQLGSDCPFFLYNQPMIGTGRGEVLSSVRLSLKGKFLVMVRPDVHVSTQSAYQAVSPEDKPDSIRAIVEGLSPEQWRGNLNNQFEAHVMSKYPLIGRIREDLYQGGAMYASMSGSGSAVYGLFSSKVDLKQSFKGLDYWSGWITE